MIVGGGGSYALTEEEKKSISEREDALAMKVLQPEWLEYQKKLSPARWRENAIGQIEGKLGLAGYRTRVNPELKDQLLAMVEKLKAGEEEL